MENFQKQQLTIQPSLFLLIEANASLFEIEKSLNDLTDINYEYGSTTALIEASKTERRDLVRLLVARGAKINQPAGPGRNTPLKEAISSGNDAMVALLIELGAHCNQPANSYIEMPLYVAIQHYKHSFNTADHNSMSRLKCILKLLIKKEAVIEWPDYKNKAKAEAEIIIKKLH